jgi:hypothetical protein
VPHTKSEKITLRSDAAEYYKRAGDYFSAAMNALDTALMLGHQGKDGAREINRVLAFALECRDLLADSPKGADFEARPASSIESLDAIFRNTCKTLPQGIALDEGVRVFLERRG